MLCISEFVSTITFPLHIMNPYQESKLGFAYALWKTQKAFCLYNIDNVCQVLGSMFWGPFLPKNICMYIIHIYTQHNQDFLFFHILMLPSLLTNKTITMYIVFTGEKSISLCPNLCTLTCRELNISHNSVCARDMHSLHFIQLLIF